MSKFHITASGEPAKCSATERACPLGGEHYDSMREAVEAMTEVEEKAAHIMATHRDGLKESPSVPTLLERELEIATRRGQLVDQGLEEGAANELLALPLADQFSVDDLRALHDWDTSEGWVLEEYAAYEEVTREEGNTAPTPQAVIRRMGEGWLKNMEEPNAEPDANTTHIYADLCRHFGAPEVAAALRSKLAEVEEASS